MIKNTLAIGMALTLLAVAAPAGAHAAQPDSTAVLTFTEPIEIPGQVLPAGSYTFSLLESMTDRHIVQISSADGTRILSTVMTVPHYRLDRTAGTVMTYRAGEAGAPAALRAWYHPNDTVGHEFVYPRSRATALAALTNEPVKALPGDEYDAATIRSAPVDAVHTARTDPVVTPGIERPVPAAERTAPATEPRAPRVPDATPPAMAPAPDAQIAAPAPIQDALDAPVRSALPATATTLPVFLLLGLGCLATAGGLLMLLWRGAPVAGV